VEWLWSTDVAEELLRRGLDSVARSLQDRHVARRYDGPGVDSLGEPGILALAGIFLDAA